MSRWKAAFQAVKSNNSSTPKPRKSSVASPILSRLYLSDLQTAQDEAELQRLGITHIVSVLEIMDLGLPMSVPIDNRLHISVRDVSESDILSHLPTTTEFIKKAFAENETNKVLVHCFMGVSRSATVVCAYLVATEGLVPVDAIAYVQSKRGIVCPNLGFRKQLETYGSNFVGMSVKKKSIFKTRDRIKVLKANTSLTSVNFPSF